MTDNKHLIHIRVEKQVALVAKKDLLSSEINLLNMLKRAKAYRDLRDKEFDLKLDLYKKTRALKLKLGDFERALPHLTMPRQKEEKQDKRETHTSKIEKYDSSIEGQLMEIQRKLDSLQGKSF